MKNVSVIFFCIKIKSWKIFLFGQVFQMIGEALSICERAFLMYRRAFLLFLVKK